jgi:hypothetical protein
MISRARVGEGAKAATRLRANDRPCMAKGHLLANRTQRFVLTEGDKVPTSRDLRPRLTRIQRALRYQADGLDLVLTGQSPLEKCWRARPQRNSTGSRHACWTSTTRCAGTGSSNAIRRAATKPGAVHSAASTGHMGEPKPGCSCNASLHPRTPASAGGPPSSTCSSRAGQQSGPIRVIHGDGQPRGTTVTDGAKMPVVTSGTPARSVRRPETRSGSVGARREPARIRPPTRRRRSTTNDNRQWITSTMALILRLRAARRQAPTRRSTRRPGLAHRTTRYGVGLWAPNGHDLR